MKNQKYIPLLLAVFGILLIASPTHAQVTATATVRLTVVPAPGISFSTSKKLTERAPVVGVNRSTSTPGITFRSPGNVLVQLNSERAPSMEYNLGEGEVKTFSARQLKHISSVEIDYLGS